LPRRAPGVIGLDGIVRGLPEDVSRSRGELVDDLTG
jgi:hypothetical protein